MFVEPVEDWSIFSFVKLHLDWFQWLDIFNVLRPRKRGLFVVKGRKSHPLEMPPITLFPSHAHPHRSPLRMEHRLDNPWGFIHHRQASVDMIKHLDLPRRLPRHRHVLQQLQHRVGHELQSAQIAPLVTAEFLL